MVKLFTVSAVAQGAQHWRLIVGLSLFACVAEGQTAIDLRTQARNVDFSGAVSTRPFKTGSALPGNCGVGELFFKTGAAAGKNVYVCSTANQWSAVSAAATAGGNYAATFTEQTSVALQHDLNTASVTIQCFDNATPPAVVEPNTISVADANRVDVNFVVAQSGACVVSGGGNGGSGGGASVSAGLGLLLTDGALRVNAAAVRSFATGSGSLDFGPIAANGGCVIRTIQITGAAAGDKVTVGAPAELMTYSLALTYAVTAVDRVAVRLCNYTGAPITPPSWTWNVDVVKGF